MKAGGKLLATAIVAAGLCAPATANAAVTATLTGDDGQPAPLTAGAPPTIRNMSASAAVQVPAGTAKSWKWVATDPTGVAATTESCWNSLAEDSSRVNYRGNGAYTLTVTTYTATNCASGAQAPIVFSWNVAASVVVGQPAGPLMTRPANTSVTSTHLLDFSGNPGATNYEIRFAKGGVIGPDGAISGPSTTAIVDSATGKIRFWNFDGPGQYVMVARAQSGDYYTAWSPAVAVTLIAPFDLSSVSFPDSRGPSYQVRGIVREKSAGSRVTIAVAKGKKGKRFRTLGKAKVNSQGVFKLRFRLSRGTYRVRYSFRGTSTVARGTVYEVITIRRVLG
jgi:hypothetical protein